MDTVQSEKILINELIAVYSNKDFLEDLETTAKSIAGKIKTLLNEKGEKEGLISKNSVRDLRYFSLVHRIKEPDSLKEKFYRSNLLQDKFSLLKFTSGADVQRKRNEVKKIFKGCDDLIGVKVLTDLNEDCKKVISILRSNKDYFDAEQILFEQDDLASQPTLMKNGLEIYKIRGTINGDYSFELQIKSKIVSAWGDMEHSIFYKDYFISPVRETTQATMNHIGKLLFQIDDFLLSVRNANKEFKSNSEVTAFLSWLDDNYSKKINRVLGGIGFKLDLMSDALYHIKTNQKRIIIRELNFNHFGFKATKELHKQYLKMRKASYDLKIFEAIVFGWFWRASQITENNIDNKLSFFFKLIVDFLADAVKKKYEGMEMHEIRSQIETYLNEVIPYTPEAKFLLSSKAYLKHYAIMVFIKGELDIMGVADRDLCYKRFDMLLLNSRMDGNCQEQIQEMKLSATELANYRERLSRINSAIKLKDKTEFKDEYKIINDIITKLK